MTVIAFDAVGAYLPVIADTYMGGKFVALDVVAPAVAADPVVLAAVVVFALWLVLDGGGSSRPAPVPAPPAVVPLPAPGLLLLAGLAGLWAWGRKA